MNEAPQLELKDIHLPHTIDWWPLAPGWWILLGAVLCLILIIFLIVSWYKRQVLYRSAKQHLIDIEKHFIASQDPIQLVKSISVLLRRISISSYNREKISSLTGSQWLNFLDETLLKTPHSKAFSSGVGQVLIEAPYNPKCQVEVNELLTLVDFWLKKNTRVRKKHGSI